MEFKFSYNDHEIYIDDAADKIKDWVVKKAEVVEYTKETVIIQAFNRDFPHIKLMGDGDKEKFKYLSNLVSRSDKLIHWYSLEKLKYSELVQLPNYMSGLIEPKEFEAIRKQVSSVNATISAYAETKRKITEKYRSDLKAQDDEMNAIIEEKVRNNNIIKILTLTTQSLPLSMVNAIESYNVKTTDSDFDEKKKLYGRELLTKFKVSLLKIVKERPDVNIDDLIDEVSLK